VAVGREPIQERKVDQIPHARQLPVAQPTQRVIGEQVVRRLYFCRP
jgi:hypothetical protein